MHNSGNTTKLPAIACIGGGNMARALVGGWLSRGLLASDCHIAEPNAAAREALRQEFGISVYAENAAACENAELWVMAVKPQVMPNVCQALRSQAEQQKPLVLSIAAGISVASMQAWLGPAARLVRAMPNTPALLGLGASGLYATEAVTASERALVVSLLEAVGSVSILTSELHMDVVTATSGSGPAYFFLLMEAMQSAAIALGLSPEIAKELVLQTALGAAHMARTSDVGPDVLRTRVTSPGGTTQAALEVFAQVDFAQQVHSAMVAATDRGKQLAQQFGG